MSGGKEQLSPPLRQPAVELACADGDEHHTNEHHHQHKQAACSRPASMQWSGLVQGYQRSSPAWPPRYLIHADRGKHGYISHNDVARTHAAPDDNISVTDCGAADTSRTAQQGLTASRCGRPVKALQGISTALHPVGHSASSHILPNSGGLLFRFPYHSQHVSCCACALCALSCKLGGQWAGMHL